MNYTVYAVKTCPEAMLSRYPTPATYSGGEVYLFGENLYDITGTPAPKIKGIDALGFNYPYVEGDDGLTEDELNTLVDSLFKVLDSSEVKLSINQGRYLWKTRFSPKSDTTPS